jgi:glycerophosphoryl diester phosphodiesterase
MQNGRPLIWAHRGASAFAPENTLPAFQKAADLGADGVELDIQMTKDGQIVVIHDERIDRTSDGSGWVKDFTLAELRRYNYQKTCPEYGHADIPLMEEVFELLKSTGLSINIELKTGVFFYPRLEAKILQLTARMGMEDRVLYSSFNHASMVKIKELNPAAKTAFLYADGTIDMPEYGRKYGVDALHPALYNIQYPDFMEKCGQYGLDVNVWTVDEPKYMKLCREAGVHAVITNDPALAIKTLS